MECNNCLVEFDGNYCSNCGQKKTTRVNLISIFKDLSNSLNFDNGIFLTISELITSPHILLNNYFKGKRKVYFNPLKFLLIFLTLNIILLSFFGKESPEIELINSPFWTFFSVLIFIPILSVCTYLLDLKKYNYAENVIISLYALGIVNLLNSLVEVSRKILTLFDLDFTLFLMFSPVIYLTWVYFKIFKKNIILIFFFSLFSYIISYILFLIILHLFGVFDIKDFAPSSDI